MNNDTRLKKEKKQLILIHGIHQNPLVMLPLKKQLTNAGFKVYSLNYPSLFAPLSTHSQQINKWLLENHNANNELYLVGHSLGGLVIRDFLYRYPNWKIANVVTLGTPHKGSITADYTKRFLPFMIGKAYKEGLDGNAPALADNISVGVIAGNKAVGIGTPFIWHNDRKKQAETADVTSKATINAVNKGNDGTVYIHETMLKEAKEHIILPVTHTGMLTDDDVAKQTIYFLNNAEFKK